eukprot:Pgem_evm1s9781
MSALELDKALGAHIKLPPSPSKPDSMENGLNDKLMLLNLEGYGEILNKESYIDCINRFEDVFHESKHTVDLEFLLVKGILQLPGAYQIKFSSDMRSKDITL